MTTIVRQRARKQPAEIRREEVLDAAVRVFARESFRGAGTAEIAREAGIAEPTIYRHFSSKRDLYLAALRRCCELVGTAFRQIDANNEDALEAIMGFAEWYDRSISGNPAHLLLRMRAESETNDDDVRRELAQAYDVLPALVAATVRRGQEQGVFKKHVSPEGVAWMFMAMGQIADLTHMLGMEGDLARQCFMDMGILFWEMLVEPATMPRVLARVDEWAADEGPHALAHVKR
ncbi:MAG: TetR/AcrR family transcriptional regulator [Tepidiformaceae bacterium]